MTDVLWTRCLAIPAIVCGLLVITGCAKSGEEAAPVAKAEEEHHEHDEEGHDHEHEYREEGHNLHGFWCAEHGIPEEICAQCNTKLAAVFQKKGDWCEEHKRPDSQCFIHHPELEEKFIAQYEVKFGKKPPARTEK